MDTAQNINTPSLSIPLNLTVDEKRKNAIKGAIFSEFIDMFDIYLPVVVMAPVMFYFQPKGLSPATEAILASLVFITTLLGRPVGALLFGIIADRIGRRKASIYSVGGFGVVTLLIGLLPGFESIGLASYLLLVLLRFIDGIFLGGGYTGAIPLALEYSRKEHRGFVGGLILSSFPAAYVAINMMAMLMFALFPLNGPGSPYAVWGWRIPFLIGALLAGLLTLYYIHKVSESEIWETEVKQESVDNTTKMPLMDLLRGRSGLALLQVLLMMSGFWITQNMITIFLPTGLLMHTLHLDSFHLTTTLMIAYALLIFSYIGSGMLGQRIGRRRFFLIAGPAIATLGAVILYALMTVKNLSFPMIILLVCALSILVTSPWGVILSYVNERFHTDVRATGFGVGYSLSVILPSFYAFYINWLSGVVPAGVAPAVLLIIGAIIATIGAGMGPETRDVDF